MSMDLFDIIGPVMVGPSSSHTAGVVRIGNVVRKLLGATPASAQVIFCGSFATTYQGHGSDRAIVAGMLGLSTEDERIRDSFALAADQEMDYTFETLPQIDGHPNTLRITARDSSGQELYVEGISVGGGNILINQINNIHVEFTGKYNTLIVSHRDAPGVIARVTTGLADQEINIANMKVYRSLKGGEAIMIIETDQHIEKGLAITLGALKGVHHITSLASLF